MMMKSFLALGIISSVILSGAAAAQGAAQELTGLEVSPPDANVWTASETGDGEASDNIFYDQIHDPMSRGFRSVYGGSRVDVPGQRYTLLIKGGVVPEQFRGDLDRAVLEHGLWVDVIDAKYSLSEQERGQRQVMEKFSEAGLGQSLVWATAGGVHAKVSTREYTPEKLEAAKSTLPSSLAAELDVTLHAEEPIVFQSTRGGVVQEP